MCDAGAEATNDRHQDEQPVKAEWSGVFVDSLYRITQATNPGFGIQRQALEHVESLLARLLLDIAVKRPHSVVDVEQHIRSTFPEPLNVWAIKEAQEVLAKSHRRHRDRSWSSQTTFPMQRVHLLLRDYLGYKFDSQITLFIGSVLQYIAADILKLTCNYVKNIRHSEITLQDLKVAMRADSVLMDLFYHGDDELLPIISANTEDIVSKKMSSLSYEQTVKDLLHSETVFLRELNMIILVFQQSLTDVADRSQLQAVFSNIVDIRECTSKFLGFLEDTVEMCRDQDVPFVGSCFLDMAESEEFDDYEKYVADILNASCLDTLQTILDKPQAVQHLDAYGSGYRLAVKYLLPRLLLDPVIHCLKYFEYLALLIKLDSSEQDKVDLVQTGSLLMSLKSRLEAKCSSLAKRSGNGWFQLRFVPAESNRSAVMKLQELQRVVDNWDTKNYACHCNEFVLEGKLKKCIFQKLSNSILSSSDTQRARPHKITDRFVFLFDSCVVLCKPTPSKRAVGGADYRLKEVYTMRKVEVVDHDDVDDLKNLLEIRQRDSSNSVLLMADSAEEKLQWMAALLMLQTRSMLERILDSHLEAEQKRIPLVLPSPEEYKFAEPDSDDNIVLEDYISSSGIPVVRGATLPKLIERLTYHMYVDPKFVRTFLTTFRAFCTPTELLQLLIERFDIPDPFALSALSPRPQQQTDTAATLTDSACHLMDGDTLLRETMKRLRKEYVQPVRIRVLNVIRQWIDHHWYDFDQDSELLANLRRFLKRIEDVHTVVKWTRSLQKIIDRKMEMDEEPRDFQFASEPPPVEVHLAVQPAEYDLMTLHPIEIARQVTLLECDLYRAVKPIELVGAAWTKKDKDKRSPQLLKLIQHSTKFTYWLEKCIVECGNLAERMAVMNRVLEIMCVFQELNNFTGLIEIYGVLESSAIHRLYHTWERLDPKLLKVFEEVKQILSDAHHKLIRERLRSINPPCVPFFGMYLTNIIFLEEGNPIFLKMPLTSQGSETDASTTADLEKPTLISFAKCRKIADIIAEIQMYQNQPYCLIVDPSIRHFFESLNPFQGFVTKNDLEAYLYNRSLEIEPKDADKPPNFAPLRKYSLKSPGIKPQKVSQSQRHKCPSASPTLLFTPLISYGRDRHHSGTATLPVRRTPNTAPASPTSKEASVFAIVEINPGEQPKHVADVSDSSLRWMPSSQSLRIRKQSHPSMDNAESGTSVSPPPVPPRQAKAATVGRQVSPGSPCLSSMSSSRQNSPFMSRSLPRSAGSGQFNGGTCFHFPPTAAAADLPCSSSDVFSMLSLSPVPISPSAIVGANKQWNSGGTAPPAIPPRTGGSTRSACFTTLPHPLPFSAIVAEPEVSYENRLTAAAADDDSDGSATNNDMAAGHQQQHSPPPLPPRGVAGHLNVEPPPRPPKRDTVLSACCDAPPLPPKTYKRRDAGPK